jgi:hypothetical protein
LPLYPFSVAKCTSALENKLFEDKFNFAGQTRGGAFAGASAGYGVGAGTAIGGSVDEHGTSGGIGSEAHAGRLNTKTVQLSRTPQQQPQQV